MATTETMLLEGIGYLRMGCPEAAEATFRTVLAQAAEHPRALYLWGLMCLRTERPDQAAALFRRALAAEPAHEGAGLNLCRAELAARRFPEAVSAADAALGRSPCAAELHFLKGTALNGLGRPQEAVAALGRAAQLAPDHAPGWLNLGNAHADLDQLEAAERHIADALRLDPGLVEGWASLGFVLTSLGRCAEARAACAEAIARRPDFAEAHWNLATAALLQGDFATGFREYEWRKRHDRFRRDFLDLPGPAWRGEKLEGKRLLVHAEQGLGDTIQLSRYVPELAARGARVILACDRRLLRLLAGAPGLDRATARDGRLPAYDFWVDQMSLPGLLGTRPETIPHAGGWLRAEPGAVARMRALMPAGRLAGIVWAGNPLHSNDRRRSMPRAFLPALIAAGQGLGFSWISLQTGERAAEARPLGAHDMSPHLGDFAGTAAALGCVDVLVSVDTSAAHLAGAMGVPAIVMLPFAPDWRWILGRDDTPWYASLRLVRQPRPGDWGSVIAEVAAALRD